jgi:hypothetical protein
LSLIREQALEAVADLGLAVVATVTLQADAGQEAVEVADCLEASLLLALAAARAATVQVDYYTSFEGDSQIRHSRYHLCRHRRHNLDCQGNHRVGYSRARHNQIMRLRLELIGASYLYLICICALYSPVIHDCSGQLPATHFLLLNRAC